ncbi:MAG: ADOP family duplicated permease [Blastocatellia bacterium]
MTWLRIFFHRLRAMFLKGKLEQELQEEIRTHLEMQTEEYQRQGMSAGAARNAALRQFGGVEQVKETYRDRRGLPLVETTLQDLRYALRMLRRSPGFTTVAVVTLALGIGANTAIFSVINAVLLRPLPFRNPERIVALFNASTENPSARGEFSYPNFIDYQARARSLESVAAYVTSGAVFSMNDEPEVVTGADVSAELFPLLGVEPLLGRGFMAEEDRPGGPPVVVLSYQFWQSHFGGDRQIIGQTIKLSGNLTVIGVMPPAFKFPLNSEQPIEYWTPLGPEVSERSRTQRGLIFLNLVGRSKEGIALEQVQTELTAIASSLEAEYPATNTGRRVRAVSLHKDLVGEIRPALLALFGAVGFVLLIACANVANLLLARASARSKEMALRAALGAGRGRIVRQLLVESLLLAALGGAAGLLLAEWSLQLFVATGPAEFLRVNRIGLDATVLAFAFFASLFTGVVFGLAPAMQVRRVDLNEVMKEGIKGSSASRAGGRFRSALVVSEVALSLVLVIGAGLLIKSFGRLLSIDPGFEPDRVVAMALPLSPSKYPGPEQKAMFFQQVIERVRGLPGVEGAAATTLLPVGEADIVYSFDVKGRPPAMPGNEPKARFQTITPGYFEVMHMGVRRGRTFTERDTMSSSQVIIINEALARRYFPDEEPIGKWITDIDEQPAREIIGIVGDVHQRGLDEEVVPIMYTSSLQSSAGQMDLIVRSISKSPSDLVPAVRHVIREVNPGQLIYRTRTLDELIAKSVAPRRFNMLLLAVFAFVALVMAATGIFGVMSFAVAQRTREVGIRMALGAQRRDILRLIVGHGMLLALLGIAVGLTAAFGLTRLISSLLFGVSASDPVTFAGVAALLVIVLLIACYLPARRAAKVDPMVALRYE